MLKFMWNTKYDKANGFNVLKSQHRKLFAIQSSILLPLRSVSHVSWPKIFIVEMPGEVKVYMVLFQFIERMSLKTTSALIYCTYKSRITISKLFRWGLVILTALDMSLSQPKTHKFQLFISEAFFSQE